jgi:hypothetical protein
VIARPQSSFNAALFAVGTAGWCLALVGLLILHRAAHVAVGDWPWVCVAGIVTGLGATGYAHFSWRAR